MSQKMSPPNLAMPGESISFQADADAEAVVVDSDRVGNPRDNAVGAHGILPGILRRRSSVVSEDDGDSSTTDQDGTPPRHWPSSTPRCVSFELPIVTAVHDRPRTHVLELASLYYGANEIKSFKREARRKIAAMRGEGADEYDDDSDADSVYGHKGRHHKSSRSRRQRRHEKRQKQKLSLEMNRCAIELYNANKRPDNSFWRSKVSRRFSRPSGMGLVGDAATRKHTIDQMQTLSSLSTAQSLAPVPDKEEEYSSDVSVKLRLASDIDPSPPSLAETSDDSSDGSDELEVQLAHLSATSTHAGSLQFAIEEKGVERKNEWPQLEVEAALRSLATTSIDGDGTNIDESAVSDDSLNCNDKGEGVNWTSSSHSTCDRWEEDVALLHLADHLFWF